MKIKKNEVDSFLVEKQKENYFLVTNDSYIKHGGWKPDLVLQGTKDYILLYFNDKNDEVVVLVVV